MSLIFVKIEAKGLVYNYFSLGNVANRKHVRDKYWYS